MSKQTFFHSFEPQLDDLFMVRLVVDYPQRQALNAVLRICQRTKFFLHAGLVQGSDGHIALLGRRA